MKKKGREKKNIAENKYEPRKALGMQPLEGISIDKPRKEKKTRSIEQDAESLKKEKRKA